MVWGFMRFFCLFRLFGFGGGSCGRKVGPGSHVDWVGYFGLVDGELVKMLEGLYLQGCPWNIPHWF